MSLGRSSDRSPEQITSPSWSVEVPRGRLVLDQHSGFLIAGRTGLASYGHDGGMRWQASVPGEAEEPPVLAPDGTILRVEGDSIVVRSGSSGDVVSSFHAPHAARLSVAPWGGLVYSQLDQADTAILSAATTAGERQWSIPLSGRGHLAFPALSIADTVVVHDDGALKALDQNGRVRWLATHNGFWSGDSNPVFEQRDRDELWTEPKAAGEASLLVGLRWYTGVELFLIDVAAWTVQPYASAAVAHNPVVVASQMEAGLRVGAQGPRREVRQMEYRWSVVILDETGSPLWEYLLEAEPFDISVVPDGSLIVSGTPSRQRWTAYGRWQDLSKESYVACIGPDGTQRWIWYAPGPLNPFPQVAPDGMVYVHSDDKVWALPV